MRRRPRSQVLRCRIPAPHADFLVNRRSGPTVFEPPGEHRRWLLLTRLTEVPPAPAHLAHGTATRNERQLPRTGLSDRPPRLPRPSTRYAHAARRTPHPQGHVHDALLPTHARNR